MSEMRKLTEKLKRGRREARKAERGKKEGKALPDLLSNLAANRGGAICCGAFENKEHMCQPLFPADESTKDETPRTGISAVHT